MRNTLTLVILVSALVGCRTARSIERRNAGRGSESLAFGLAESILNHWFDNDESFEAPLDDTQRELACEARRKQLKLDEYLSKLRDERSSVLGTHEDSSALQRAIFNASLDE